VSGDDLPPFGWVIPVALYTAVVVTVVCLVLQAVTTRAGAVGVSLLIVVPGVVWGLVGHRVVAVVGNWSADRAERKELAE
jgi:hypothetical protein